MNNFLEIISQKLEEKDFSFAVQVLNDAAYESELKKHVRDLVPLLLKNGGKDAKVDEKDDLMVSCDRILEIIALKADPEEAVLEFLEQMDNADSVKFSLILKLLFICLERCTHNRMRYIETSLVTIRSCLEDVIVCDKDFVVEEAYEEELCNKLNDITLVLESVLDFYAKFISLISSKNPGYDTDGMVNLFLSRLVQMFDFFLPTSDSEVLQPLNNAKIHTLKLIKMLLNNAFYLLEFIFFRNLRQQNIIKGNDKINYETANLRVVCDDIQMDHMDENLSVFENDYVISNLGYAVFFYTILCSSKGVDMKIPSVYNPKFVFLSLAPLSVSFLEKTFNKHIIKGLQFFQTLLNLLHNIKLKRLDLYFQYHEKILTHLNNIMIYSQNENIRKMAVTCFKKYVDSFDYEAKYLLLINIRPSIEHSGTLGLLITQLKEYVSHYIDSESCQQYSKYYSGKLLYDIFTQYCFLTHGEKTDLVLNADQIISSLNMLRFILLKDKKNKTGLRNYLKEIEENFLKPLRNGIDLSKDFYKLRLEDLRKNSNVPNNSKVELTVNGQCLDNITKEQQENALFSSLNAVDLIDSLLNRVQECVGFWYSISWKKSFSSNQDSSSDSNDPNNSGTDRVYEDDIKLKILESSLPFVNKHGWTKAAINDGAASIGYPGVIHGIFSNPSAELINYFNKKCNSELKESLKKSVESVEDSVDPKKFIEYAFQSRLKMIIPYIEKWPQALAIMSVPNNLPTAFETFSSLIDDVCYLSGDKSVDFNWYSRRAALALIYKTTELCMIQDKTADYIHTWKFLERRLNEAFKVDEIIRSNNNFAHTIKEVTKASFTTLGNIIGWNHSAK